MDKIHELLHNLARRGVFGSGQIVRVAQNCDAVAGPQFASTMSFFNIGFERDSTVEEIRVVVKIQPSGERQRELFNSNLQFLNEVTMYSQILPLLGAEEINVSPKFFHGKAIGDPLDDVIILEDLSPSGYGQLREQYMNENDVKITMKMLGKFHGLSYKVKKTRKTELTALGALLRGKQFEEDYDSIFTHVLKRGFDEVMRKNPTAEVLLKAFDKVETLGPQSIWVDLSSPVEPFACIVHGDFNKNNLLFKTNQNGDVEDVKFIDFQISIYADPSIDIAFFLYMNTSRETRDVHWDDFLVAYWDGVISVEPDPEFTFQEFLANFEKKAFFGYLPSSFFLPMMLKTDEDIPMEEHLKWSVERRSQRLASAAGDVGTQAVGDIVQHLLGKGFLDAFVDKTSE